MSASVGDLRMNPDEREAFGLFLTRSGAELLAPTNPSELFRFRARGGVHIIYVRRTGFLTIKGAALEALRAFRAGSRWDAGTRNADPRHAMKRERHALFERDGRACWFCGEDMPDDDMTVEHLVGRNKGGPDHLDNLVLAHQRCNIEADNLPLKRKIEIHCQHRSAA